MDNSQGIYYENEYGLEIQLPKSWIAKQSEFKETKRLLFYHDIAGNLGDNYFDIRITPNFNKNLIEWTKYIREDADKSADVQLFGVPAVRLENMPGSDAPGNIFYYLIKGNVGYQFSYVYYDKSDGVGETILSNIKFK